MNLSGLTLGVMTGLAVGASPAQSQNQGPEPVRAVDSVDLERYAGRWYEIARLPNPFQGKCTGEVTADYELLAKGEVRVVNQCLQEDGKVKRAEGRARRANRDGTAAKLKVRFAPAFLSFLPMVWGDYWVLDLTDDYSAALVGEPGRAYLWILSRAPVLADSTYQRMTATAERQGFAVERLIVSPAQTEASPPAGTSSQ